jgi:hypothetical protein
MALIKNLVIPLFKKTGIIDSNNKIIASAARAAGYSVTTKSTPTTADVSVSKRKYASIGSSQMRSGRSSTIQTSSTGLMSSAKIGKKTLLGS